MSDLNKVWKAYERILDQDDKRHITLLGKSKVEDFMQGFDLDKTEAEYLYRLIKDYNDPDVISPYDQDNKKIGEAVQESIHQSYDGWTDAEKVIIELYLNDIGRAVTNM